MGDKIRSIEELRALGLNTHNTVIARDLAQANLAAKRFGNFTIRTDLDSTPKGGWGNTQLPFLVCNPPPSDEELTYELWKLLNRGYILIISDGIKYDPIQSYNGVLRLSRYGEFHLEFSTEKVPLRLMYNYPKLLDIVGTLADGVIELYGEAIDSSILSPVNKDLLKDIGDIYTLGIYDRSIEFTKYPIKVGIKPDYFVFWQIRKD